MGMLLERLNRPVRGVRIVRKGALEQNDAGLVQLIPMRQLTRPDVDRLLRHLQSSEQLVVTSALSRSERQVFLDAGFIEREALHLLSHDLTNTGQITTNVDVSLRAGRRTDLNRVLAIDRASFDDFWMLDRDGLNNARKATPVHRYTVAHIDQQLVGYAITGRSGASTFLQRLGVDPKYRRRNIGSTLVHDALTWARREGGTSMLVNTQVGNEKAVGLYQHLGFDLLNEQLKVLEWSNSGTVSSQ